MRGSGFPKLRAWVAARVIAFVALLLVALLPAGNMPARGIDGGLTIVICTGEGMKSIRLDGSDAPVDAVNHCAFGLLSAAADLIAPVTGQVAVDWVVFAVPRESRAAVVVPAMARPSARDPPILT